MSRIFFILLASLMLLFSCEVPVSLNLNEEAIIPLPVSVEATYSSFHLSENTRIYVNIESHELHDAALFLQQELQTLTGGDLQIEQVPRRVRSGNIVLAVSDTVGLPNNEGYRLSINEKVIKLEAINATGIFRGIQTLRQILPYKIESETLQGHDLLLASGVITDYPEYEYRGAMLDVARHFFDVDDVKKFIDYLAYYKLNVLHLHLSDDQGWRIEIKSWPKLTKIGGKTQVGGGEGGFYTQAEFKEIIDYAAQNHITIIPEIDMPGHTNAALVAYAELNCDGKARKAYTGTRVGFSTLCTDKEITYKFVDDVVGELAEMCPGKYIHIGGDESHVTPLKDYIPFINRVQKIVQSHGKIMIGWDEIAHAELDSASIVQFWSRERNALKGIAKGTKVIVSPAKRAYLDMKYNKESKLGLDWAALIEVDDAYTWDPANYANGINREHILGVESPLWSETIETIDDIEYLAFPRLVGHAEIGWTPMNQRNWADYKKRLAKHAPKMKALGIDFYRSELVNW